MMTRKGLYTIARWGFSLASILYLTRFVVDTLESQSNVGLISRSSIFPTIIASVVFSLTALLSALGWRGLLGNLSYPRPLLEICRVFWVTQIAKYVPGNVAHHLGRVALAKTSLGIPTAVSFISIVQESALICLSALLVGVMLFTFGANFVAFDGAVGIHARTALLAVISAGLLGLLIVNTLRGRARTTIPLHGLGWIFQITPSWDAVRSTLAFYIAINILNGVAVAFAASQTVPMQASDFLLLTGAYALSWMIGFLLPGAPGGLGVREAALILLLGHSYSASAVLSISLLSRVASTGADLLIFCGGVYLSRHMRQEHAAK